MLYPETPFHAINVGISGDRAPNGLKRLAGDVLSRLPDLTVVCYGLNDCSAGEGSIEKYVGALEGIFTALRAAGSEILFMTPNTMCFYVSPGITDGDVRAVAAKKAALQTKGVMDRYIEAALALCQAMNVDVCDCYGVWQAMQKSGVDTTALLSNAINHPTREMHELFAVKLLDALFEGGE
jgi:lysophospholipase L1-like esterase